MQKNGLNIFICYCPGADPVLPHAALPALGGALRDYGARRYSLWDLNLEAFLHFLTGERLAAAINKVYRRVANNGFKTIELQQEARQLLGRSRELPGRIEQSMENFRNPEAFYDVGTFLELRRDFNDACRLVSLQYDRVELQKYSIFPHAYDSFADIRRALDDPETSMIRDFYQAFIIPRVLEQTPAVLGISIAYFSQLIPSFLLAETVRGVSPGTHIILGGPVATWGKDVLTREADRFSTLIDSFCLGEGEQCLRTLATVLKSGGGLSGIPNLVYYERGKASANARAGDDVALEAGIAPDYKNMPMERYLAPDRIISLPLTKGCYFNRCKFCNYSFTRLSPYRECAPGAAVRNIAGIVAETGDRVFSFESDVARGSYLYRFSRALLDAAVRIKWHACMRFESDLTQELFDTLADAGCVRLYMGLESANQRVLDDMHKGIKLETVEQVLHCCQKAGIYLEVGVFIGYPGETLEESRDTLEFLRRNRDKIKRVDPAVFRILKGAPVEEELPRYRLGLKKNRDAYWFTMEMDNPFIESHKEEFTRVLEEIQNLYPALAAMDVPEEILFTARKGGDVVDQIAGAYVEQTGETQAGAKSRYIYY